MIQALAAGVVAEPNLDQIKLSVRLSCPKLSVGAVLPRRNLEQTEAGFLADRKAHANLDQTELAILASRDEAELTVMVVTEP